MCLSYFIPFWAVIWAMIHTEQHWNIVAIMKTFKFLDTQIGQYCSVHKCRMCGFAPCTKEDFKSQILHFNPELFCVSFISLEGHKQVCWAELKHCTEVFCSSRMWQNMPRDGNWMRMNPDFSWNDLKRCRVIWNLSRASILVMKSNPSEFGARKGVTGCASSLVVWTVVAVHV